MMIMAVIMAIHAVGGVVNVHAATTIHHNANVHWPVLPVMQ